MKSVKYIICISFMLYASFAKAVPPVWSVNPQNYSYSMTLTGLINISGTESVNTGDLIAAFVGDECRGVASPVLHTPSNRYVCYLLVYSNAVAEEIVFKVYNKNSDKIEIIPEKLPFEVNGTVGNLEAPYVWSNPSLNHQAEMLTFSFDEQLSEAVFNEKNIKLNVKFGVDLTKIAAKFELSKGAELFLNGVKQVSGVTVNNFTQKLQFTVRSENYRNSAVYEVTVSQPQEKLPATNTITPDGDEINDYWHIENLATYAGFELFIFNSAGLQVYHTLEYQNDWNGNYNSTPLPRGTYYYLFKSETKVYKGTISILRN